MSNENLCPEEGTLKIVAEKVINECLDAECEAFKICISDLGCPEGTTFNGLVDAAVVDVRVTALIIAPNLVQIRKQVDLRLSWLCNGELIESIFENAIDIIKVLPLEGAVRGPRNRIVPIFHAEVAGFEVVEAGEVDDVPVCPGEGPNQLVVHVGIFVVVKKVQLVDLCVTATLQEDAPPECTAEPPCGNFTTSENLERIWDELQGNE